MNIETKISELLENQQFKQARVLINTLEEPTKTTWKGWLIVHEDGLSAGEQFCLPVLREDPSNASVWSILGWVYWEQDHPEKALATYQKSLLLDWSVSAYLNAVSLACELGWLLKARELIELYEDTLQIQDLSSYDLNSYLLCKAIVARENGQASEAIQLLSSIDDLVPEVFILRGHVYRDEFLYLQSMMAYQNGLDIFPMHPVLLEAFQSVLHYLPSIPKGVHSLLADQPNSVDAFLKVRAYLERTRAELLERDGESPEVRHLSAAIHGANPTSPPPGYVEQLFDDYAERFESHLLEKLDYQVPRLIESVVYNRFTTEQRSSLSWDLGCGTGLLGTQLKSISHCLVGVDISVKMLERAKAKDCYDEVVHQDIIEFLSSASNTAPPDLIVVADTLVYIGDLRPFLSAVAHCMSHDTQLICTIERLDDSTEDGFQLMPTGRYSHDIRWIEWLLPQCGLTLQNKGAVVLRQGGGTWVHGWLLIIERAIVQ